VTLPPIAGAFLPPIAGAISKKKSETSYEKNSLINNSKFSVDDKDFGIYNAKIQKEYSSPESSI
tara:strand:- start:1533 stop:1724 length:192 start_codon:yes stop_codon:yes gene_type:complete